MGAPQKLTVADQAMIHALTVLATSPWGIGVIEDDMDARIRAMLSEILPRVSRGNAALRPLIKISERIISWRGELGSLRHWLREPLNDWNRHRLTAAMGAMSASEA